MQKAGSCLHCTSASTLSQHASGGQGPGLAEAKFAASPKDPAVLKHVSLTSDAGTMPGEALEIEKK